MTVSPPSRAALSILMCSLTALATTATAASPGRGVRSIQWTVRQGGAVTQAQLLKAFAEVAATREPDKFRKTATQVGFRIPADAAGLADVPASILERLGEIDKVDGYADRYIRDRRGDHVVLQFKKDGAPDFYISKGSAAIYETLPPDTPGAAEQLAAVREVVGAGVRLEVIRKLATIPMFPATALGGPADQDFVIEAPWGGTQTGTPGVWVVHKGEGAEEEAYLCNAEPGTGLPIGYMSVE